jgi:hypothetical protein
LMLSNLHEVGKHYYEHGVDAVLPPSSPSSPHDHLD